MPNVMAALPNIGGAICSTTQFGWRPLLEYRALTLPRRETRWNLQGGPKLANNGDDVNHQLVEKNDRNHQTKITNNVWQNHQITA